MMDYNEMAARVLARRDAWKEARRRRRRRAAMGVACCCGAALLCVGLLGRLPALQPPAGTYPGVENLQQSREEIWRPLPGQQTTGPVNAAEEVPADGRGGYHEAVRGYAPQEIAAFFGGSYLDEVGRFTVVLTEDTPENRAAVCRVLEVDVEDTAFVAGGYTLDQLTALQSRISAAMMRGQLPFVISSGVYEAENCVVVRVTDDEPALLQPLLALDDTGGALRIQISAGASTQELTTAK